MEEPDMFDVIQVMMKKKMDITFIPLINLAKINMKEGDDCELVMTAPKELGRRLENNEQFKGAMFMANSQMFVDTYAELMEKYTAQKDKPTIIVSP